MVYTSNILVLLFLAVICLGTKYSGCGDKANDGFRSYVERGHNSRGEKLKVTWNCELENAAEKAVRGCPQNLPSSSIPNYYGRFDVNVKVNSNVVLARQILNSWFYGSDRFQEVRRNRTKVGCAIDKCRESEGMTVAMACFYGN